MGGFFGGKVRKQNGCREVVQICVQAQHDAVEDDGGLERAPLEADLDAVLSEVRLQCEEECAGS